MDARWLKGKEVDKDERRKEVMAWVGARVLTLGHG